MDKWSEEDLEEYGTNTDRVQGLIQTIVSEEEFLLKLKHSTMTSIKYLTH